MGAFWTTLGAADAQHITWWSMCLRALIVAATGLVLIRIVGARTFSRASPADILVSIILGSNLSRAITGSVKLWPTMLASAVIVLLHALLVRLGVYSHLAGRITKGRTAILVKDGEACRRTLRREGVSRGDLEEVLRSAGLTDVSEVRLAVRERSGKVSVLKYRPAGVRDPAADTRPRGDLEHAAVADAQDSPEADGRP